MNDTKSISYTTKELPMEVNWDGHNLRSDWLLQSKLPYHPFREMILHGIVEDEWALRGPQNLVMGTHWVQSMTCSQLNELGLLVRTQVTFKYMVFMTLIIKRIIQYRTRNRCTHTRRNHYVQLVAELRVGLCCKRVARGPKVRCGGVHVISTQSFKNSKFSLKKKLWFNSKF
jgi:hypothetical protein